MNISIKKKVLDYKKITITSLIRSFEIILTKKLCTNYFLMISSRAFFDLHANFKTKWY
jgi:hypothetical protein